MGDFKKQGVYWVDYYVNGHRKRKRIGPDKRLGETVVWEQNRGQKGKAIWESFDDVISTDG
jgi:hypothetical protein